MKWREDRDTLCPFYIRDSSTELICESPFAYKDIDTKVLLHPYQKAKHMNEFCRSRYTQCPVYIDVMRKYEKEQV